jgi:hypothetical protein
VPGADDAVDRLPDARPVDVRSLAGEGVDDAGPGTASAHQLQQAPHRALGVVGQLGRHPVLAAAQAAGDDHGVNGMITCALMFDMQAIVIEHLGQDRALACNHADSQIQS